MKSKKTPQKPATAASAATGNRKRRKPVAATPPAPPAIELVERQVDAAKRLGITDRNLRLWMRQPGFPDCSAGYPIVAIEEWRDARDLKGAEYDAEVQRLKRETLEEKLRQERVKAAACEREEEIARGNVLAKDEYELFLAELISVARDRLLAIPKELCRLVPKKLQKRLQEEGRREVSKILEDLARRANAGPTDA